jgi:hypothetical protein
MKLGLWIIIIMQTLLYMPVIVCGFYYGLSHEPSCQKTLHHFTLSYQKWLLVNSCFFLFIFLVLFPIHTYPFTYLLVYFDILLAIFSTAWTIIGITIFWTTLPPNECVHEPLWQFGFFLFVMQVCPYICTFFFYRGKEEATQ